MQFGEHDKGDIARAGFRDFFRLRKIGAHEVFLHLGGKGLTSGTKYAWGGTRKRAETITERNNLQGFELVHASKCEQTTPANDFTDMALFG